MNQQDRDNFDTLAEKVDTIAAALVALEYLGRPEVVRALNQLTNDKTVTALTDLVRSAPTLAATVVAQS
jgi:hypothetical protein